ncbi:tetratricopeptide repeat protein 9C-like [Watersipora subatra]|uniref:tetratricopeptide repeat protein 9C-like n=1 Tax=Watersipora subatra TaxID=2589382 RepID=UPI00355B5BE1
MESLAVDGFSRGSLEKIERLLEDAKKCKEQGNMEYAAQDYRKAIRNYHKALLYLRSITQGQDSVGTVLGMSKKEGLPQDLQTAINKLSSDCHNNLAACLMSKPQPDYDKVITYCNLVIETQPGNPKAHVRKGIALYNLKDFGNALTSLLKAKDFLGDGDSKVNKYIKLCHQHLRTEDKKLKVLYQNMFKQSTA